MSRSDSDVALEGRRGCPLITRRPARNSASADLVHVPGGAGILFGGAGGRIAPLARFRERLGPRAVPVPKRASDPHSNEEPMTDPHSYPFNFTDEQILEHHRVLRAFYEKRSTKLAADLVAGRTTPEAWEVDMRQLVEFVSPSTLDVWRVAT